MAPTSSQTLLPLICQVYSDPRLRSCPDQELLQRFRADRDQAAFATLLRRHGPMVLDVCRGVLANEADAEDAFQATFLVLARKAHSIRKLASVASWLHGVAYRTARKAQTGFATRNKHEERVAQPVAVRTADDLTWREVRQVVHEELNRLPGKLRAALVVCYLQGKTQDQAAEELSLPKGTLKGRLERGRELLRARLVRRGLGSAAVLVAPAWPGVTPAAELPAALVDAAVKAATGPAACQAAHVSGKALALASSVLNTTCLTKVKVVLAALVVVGILCLGASVCLSPSETGGRAGDDEPERPTVARAAQPGAAGEQGKEVRLDRHGDPLPRGAVARLGTLRWRPRGGATCLAVSADGRWVASGASQNIVRLWDAATGREIRHWQSQPLLRGNASVQIYALAFSPDGRQVAVSNSAGIVEVRDVATGTAIHRFPRDVSGQVTALAYAAGGRWLAAGNAEGGIALWDVGTGKKLRSCPGHKDVVGCLAFSPDGKRLAAAGRQDPLVRVWETATGNQVQVLRGHDGGVECVAFAAGGATLLSVSSDQTIRHWDVASGREVRRVKPAGSVIHDGVGPSLPAHPAAGFSPDGKILASLSEKKRLRLWDVTTGKEIRVLAAEPTGVSDVAYSADGKFVAAVGADQTLRLWDVGTGAERGTVERHRDWIAALAFTPDGKHLASASWDRTARVWDVASGKEQKQFVHPGPVVDVALSDDRKVVTVGWYKDNTVKLWDLATAGLLHEWKGEKTYFCSAAFSPGDRYLAAGNGVDAVVLWDVASKKQVRQFTGPGWRIAYSRDGKVIAATGPNKDFYLWDAATGRQIHQHRQPSNVFGPSALAFSRDSKLLALGFEDRVALHDGATGKPLRQLGARRVHTIAFSPDGKLLATGTDTDDGPHLALLDVTADRVLYQWQGHQGGVRAVAFSPDGRQLASAGGDTTILVWDVSGLLANVGR